MAEERSVADGLAELRKKIDALDEALVRLLNTRAACALVRVRPVLGEVDDEIAARVSHADFRVERCT